MEHEEAVGSLLGSIGIEGNETRSEGERFLQLSLCKENGKLRGVFNQSFFGLMGMEDGRKKYKLGR